jgi:hypothetical protein
MLQGRPNASLLYAISGPKCHGARILEFYATLRYSTLSYAISRYSTILYATLHYSTLLHASPRYSTLLYAFLRYSTPKRYSTPLYATLRYCTLRYAKKIKKNWGKSRDDFFSSKILFSQLWVLVL